MTSLPEVASLIDPTEVTELALALGNIPSPPGHELAVADFLSEWLDRHDLRPQRIAMLPERPCVVGSIEGEGQGYSLVFNAHMDTAQFRDAVWASRDPNKRIYHSAWVEGDRVFGEGVVNDKGPMASFLVAAKAMKRANVKLKGDLVLMLVPGEIGIEPVDEFEAPGHLSKEVGTRYAITHGAVGDCALVAEGTNFQMVWVEAGKAFFKVTVFGEPGIYTPYIRRPTKTAESPNAIVRAARAIEDIEAWALEYEQRHTMVTPGGTVTPRVNIGAVRGGYPFKVIESSEVCSLYLDVRLAPGQQPLEVREELRELLRRAGIDGTVELFLYRPGYQAQNVDLLTDAVRHAHRSVLSSEAEIGRSPISSMWRDNNVFSELGIPAITYGPGGATGDTHLAMRTKDLHVAAQIYADVALRICTAPRVPS